MLLLLAWENARPCHGNLKYMYANLKVNNTYKQVYKWSMKNICSKEKIWNGTFYFDLQFNSTLDHSLRPYSPFTMTGSLAPSWVCKDNADWLLGGIQCVWPLHCPGHWSLPSPLLPKLKRNIVEFVFWTLLLHTISRFYQLDWIA